MARVSVEQSQRIVRSSKGIKMFKFEPGELYHIIFLGEKVGETEDGQILWEPIMYMNPVHDVRKDGKGFRTRCANEKYNISDVVLRDESGKVLKDPRTGRPFNDGSCPYCELHRLYAEMVFAERDKFVSENPGISDKEVKNFLRKKFLKSPVTQAQQQRVFLVAVLEIDAKGKPITDTEGNKIYSIMGMEFSEHRFTNKLLEQVELVKMGLEDENDKGIAWHEYYFKFPKAENKMVSGKDMSITPVSSPVLKQDKELFKELVDEVEKLDLDALEDLMYIYKLKTIEEMERDIAPLMSLVRDNMSEEDIEDAKEVLGEDDVISDDDIEELIGEDIKGEGAFKVEVTDEDIENMM